MKEQTSERPYQGHRTGEWRKMEGFILGPVSPSKIHSVVVIPIPFKVMCMWAPSSGLQPPTPQVRRMAMMQRSRSRQKENKARLPLLEISQSPCRAGCCCRGWSKNRRGWEHLKRFRRGVRYRRWRMTSDLWWILLMSRHITGDI